ncbi:MAG: peptidoglycan DD-metalloendopeptidase family protein [Neisseriaceae bacterium]|nr:peptidoglycan DD-metalloendopeptidase family protein [Neisseriaceae bacterium]
MQNTIKKSTLSAILACVTVILVMGLSACSNVSTAPIPSANQTVPVGYHRVKSGDTLYAIAQQYKQSVTNLRTWNSLNANSDITVGQLLKVNKSASNSSVAVDPPKTLALIWPVQGTVLAQFDGTSQKGIDIGGVLTSPIKAAASGEVIYVGNAIRGYGNMVIVKHTNYFTTTYAQLNRALVTEGQKVSQGQVIGEMGESVTDRPKLYFEVRYQGKVTNPLDYLP